MSTIDRFEDSRTWMDARKLVNEIYSFTGQGKASKDFGYKDQVRRSSLSVMNNIAEGFESQTNKTFFSYLSKAKASCGETRSLMYVALDQSYIEKDRFEDLKRRCELLSIALFRWIIYLDKEENRNKVRELGLPYNTNSDTELNF